MHWVVVKNKSTVVSVVCTCTLCNNDIPHHSGQNLLRIHLAPSHESITFWLLWWQTSLSIGEQTMLNHFRFVKFISFQYFTFSGTHFITTTLVMFDVIVISFCALSLMLCTRSIYKSLKLAKVMHTLYHYFTDQIILSQWNTQSMYMYKKVYFFFKRARSEERYC